MIGAGLQEESTSTGTSSLGKAWSGRRISSSLLFISNHQLQERGDVEMR